MGRFDGKVALITGGARGQGRTHALALACEGADIAICDIAAEIDSVAYPLATVEDLKETQRLVEAEGRRCVAVEADTRDFGQVESFVERTVGELGRVDLAVANAGVVSMAPVDQMSPQQWSDVVDTDLTGVFHTLRTVSPHMKAQGYGRIVATASMMGRQGTGGAAHYCAAKWGIIGLIKSAAIDLAPFGITVNAVAPGNVRTGMVVNDWMYSVFCPGVENPTLEDMLPGLQSLHELPVPLIEPEDVSNAIVFLMSEEARYITGATIDVAVGNNCHYTA